MVRRVLEFSYKYARRIVISIVGLTVLILGVIMIVTPGPAFVVIPVGLAILGLEFAWARRWLHVVKEKADNMIKNKSIKSAKQKRDDKRA